VSQNIVALAKSILVTMILPHYFDGLVASSSVNIPDAPPLTFSINSLPLNFQLFSWLEGRMMRVKIT
jgi:hypothetical protein